jgi:putative copper resistance protein D
VSAGPELPLVVARFIVVTLGVGLFGEAMFQLYAPPGAARRRVPPAVRALAALVAAGAGIAWLAMLTGEATGAVTPGALVQLCTATSFGRALAVVVVLALALVALPFIPRQPPQAATILAGGLLASLAFVGHAAGARGAPGAVRIADMALHLMFAGIWLGGILPLAIALPAAGDEAWPLLKAFGKVALGSVAVLATTGMIAAGTILALADRPPGRLYITTFGIKLALVLALLGVASINRWALTPLAARSPKRAVRLFAWTIATEQVLALALLAVVARLAQTDPGI